LPHRIASIVLGTAIALELALVALVALAVALLRLASTELAAALSDDVSVSLLILLLKLGAAELIDDVSVEHWDSRDEVAELRSDATLERRDERPDRVAAADKRGDCT
jgi:hypothetical protein